jgi:hypothetical protein
MRVNRVKIVRPSRLLRGKFENKTKKKFQLVTSARMLSALRWPVATPFDLRDWVAFRTVVTPCTIQGCNGFDFKPRSHEPRFEDTTAARLSSRVYRHEAPYICKICMCPACSGCTACTPGGFGAQGVGGVEPAEEEVRALSNEASPSMVRCVQVSTANGPLTRILGF